WWLNHQVPRILDKIKPDVVHFTKAAVPSRKILPTVVTIYDVIPLLYPQGQKLSRRWYWRRALKQAAQFSDRIITISNVSKRDLVEQLDVSADKVTVTPLAVDTDFFKPVDRRGVVKPYILFVGTLEPRKNVPMLVRAFSRIAGEVPHDLIIAGRPEKDIAAVKREIDRSKAVDRIKLIGRVSGNDLPALYSDADLFVWPSIYEGWGFPPQEAMACGTPVIVSDGGSLPEVVGEVGEVVSFAEMEVSRRTGDVDFEERLAKSVLDLLNNKEKRKNMSEQGLLQARENTWQQVVEMTMSVYKQLT
ncbi:MAG: glycosyltransferase family 1 protein, partial [Candidatus Andersenbacteria bacterium]|nr:glycosyltransferase family 1 protein [Candidatus Andersenbacteria bacterium]